MNSHQSRVDFYLVEVVIQSKAQDIVREMRIPGSRISEDLIKAGAVERAQIYERYSTFQTQAGALGTIPLTSSSIVHPTLLL